MNKIRWILLLAVSGLFGCSSGPKPIDYGKEDCAFCKMTIMDRQFGCQIMNTKGKHYNFDDLSCMIGYLQTDILAKKDIAAMYVPEYNGNHAFLKAEEMHYVASGMLHSPMAGNVAAFANKDSAQQYAASLKGKLVDWNKLIKANE